MCRCSTVVGRYSIYGLAGWLASVVRGLPVGGPMEANDERSHDYLYVRTYQIWNI